MKSVFAFVSAVVMVCGGCASSRMTADGRRVERASLRSMSHNTRSPEHGKVYVHKGGRGMKVIQALEGGVLARPVVSKMELGWRGQDAVNDKMTIYVETSQKYLDDEFLKAGLYEYVGRYTYTAVHDVRRTVRWFREVESAKE